MDKDRNRSIFEFDDYRNLLRYLFDVRKKENPKFSHRYFARAAGFKSPNFLMKVMQGKSNLSPESVEKFIKAFKLTADEGRFFRHLVLLNQASDFVEKETHSREIRRLHSYRQLQPLKDAQYDYYAKWYFIPVREMVALPDFREDYEWIANSLVPSITPKQAEEAITQLKRLGLIAYNDKGRLVPASANVATADEVISTSIVRYHEDSMKLAFESIARVPRQNRDISAVTLGIARENVKKAKEIISQFRRDILELSNQHPQPDGVYQLNIQLFPIAEVRKGDGKKHEG